MKFHTGRVLLTLCFLLVAWCPAQAQNRTEGTEDSCRKFTQGFYDWYVAQVFKLGERDAPWHVALKYRGNSFSRELARALRASEAEAKADGDPVLDFEPILNTQDPAEHYVVRAVRVTQGQCLANIYGRWSRPVASGGEAPNVVAEMVFEKGRWVFTNFNYPASGNAPSVDLLKMLRAHDKDPENQSK